MQQKYKDAIDALKQTLKLKKEDSSVYTILADSYFRIHDYGNALYNIEIALTLAPLDEFSITLKAHTLWVLNRKEESLITLNRAIELIPQSGILLNSRADLFRKSKEFDKAFKDVFEALSIEPDHPTFYRTLAEIYGDNNEIESFYVNLTNALSGGLGIIEMRTARDAYQRFKKEERFIELLRSFNLYSEEIFHDEIPSTGIGIIQHSGEDNPS